MIIFHFNNNLSFVFENPQYPLHKHNNNHKRSKLKPDETQTT